MVFCASIKFACCGLSLTHYAKQTSHNQVSAWFASEAAVYWLWHANSTTCPRRWAVPCMLRICCFAPSAAAAFENTACSRAASIACCASVNTTLAGRQQLSNTSCLHDTQSIWAKTSCLVCLHIQTYSQLPMYEYTYLVDVYIHIIPV